MRSACAKRNKLGYLFEFQKYFCSINEISQAFFIPSSHLNYRHLLPFTAFSLDISSEVIAFILLSYIRSPKFITYKAFNWYIGLARAILTFADPDNNLAQLPSILPHSNVHLGSVSFELHWNSKLHILSIHFSIYPP